MPSKVSQQVTTGRLTRSRNKPCPRPASFVLPVFLEYLRTLSSGGRSSKEECSPCVEIVKSEAEADVEENASNGLCRRCRNMDFGRYLERSKSSNYSVQWWKLEDMQAPSCQLCAFVRDKVRELYFNDDVCRYMPREISRVDYVQTSSVQLSQTERLVYFQPELNILPPYDIGMHAIIHTFTPSSPYHSMVRGNLFHAGTADLHLARSWVEFCHECHGNTCGTRSQGTPFGLKVIDCFSHQICVAPTDCIYVALSYLWGNQSSDLNSRPSQIDGVLPRTIEDAIHVAKQLGIPYLWVDRYCIDQDNEEEKHNMISNMDRIYSGAALTIIAAAGAGPNHGLPGVTARRQGRNFEYPECGSFIVMPRVRKEIAQSTWAIRGWTYQEMLLSPRRLIFTQSQMYFHCCEQEFREAFSLPSPYFDTPDMGGSDQVLPNAAQLGNFTQHYGREHRTRIFPKNGIGSSATDIYKRIREYSFRQLSYPTDRLNAFDGVFNAFRRAMPAYIHHFWGIPILDRRNEPGVYKFDMLHGILSSFLAGLAWNLVRMGEDRSVLPKNSREQEWPSWSWSSVSDRKLAENYGLSLKFQKGITVMLTHMNGKSNSLGTYASEQCDYREYQPWIDLTTWVLEDVELHYSKMALKYGPLRSKWSASKDFTTYADIDGESLKGHIIAIYIGTQELPRYDASRQHYIVARKNPDGTYRRVGYGKLAVGPAASKEHDKYNKRDKLTWLPGLESRKSFNDWKHKCIRLV